MVSNNNYRKQNLDQRQSRTSLRSSSAAGRGSKPRWPRSPGRRTPAQTLRKPGPRRYLKMADKRWLHGNEVACLLLIQRLRVRLAALPKYFQKEKLLMLLRSINGAGYRKVDSGLKMLIKPILVVARGKPVQQQQKSWQVMGRCQSGV